MTKSNLRFSAQCGDDEPRIFDLSVIGPKSEFEAALEKGLKAFNDAFRESIELARKQAEEKQAA